MGRPASIQDGRKEDALPQSSQGKRVWVSREFCGPNRQSG